MGCEFCWCPRSRRVAEHVFDGPSQFAGSLPLLGNRQQSGHRFLPPRSPLRRPARSPPARARRSAPQVSTATTTTAVLCLRRCRRRRRCRHRRRRRTWSYRRRRSHRVAIVGAHSAAATARRRSIGGQCTCGRRPTRPTLSTRQRATKKATGRGETGKRQRATAEGGRTEGERRRRRRSEA